MPLPYAPIEGAPSRMPRYFFDVNDGTLDVDDEGTTLPDIEAARRQAARIAVDYAASLASEGVTHRSRSGAVVVTVRDEVGATGIVARLALMVEGGLVEAG